MIRPCSAVLPRLINKPFITPLRTIITQVDTTSKPTSIGYIATKDLTPRPNYGPEPHPTYPILNLKEPKTNQEVPYLILGYTGHSKENAENILENGFTHRVFTTPYFKHAADYAHEGKIFTLGIHVSTFIDIANSYKNTQHTVQDLLSSPSRCIDIQGTQERHGNILGFESDDRSEGFRDVQSQYIPLRNLITLKATILDIKESKNPNKNSLDAALNRDIEISSQYQKDNSLIYQLSPQWLKKAMDNRTSF